mgnify:CR=1 FL=1
MKAMVLFSGGIDSTTCLGWQLISMMQKCYSIIYIIWSEAYKGDRGIR